MAPFTNTRRRRRVKSITTIPKSKPKTTATKRRSNSIPKTSIKTEKEAAHLAPASSSSSSVSGDGFDDSSIIIDGGFDSNNVVSVHNEGSICSTPKGQRFRIPKIEACPPAPRKKQRDEDEDENALFSASASSQQRSNCSSLQRRPVAFFAPPDLELFFFFARRHISV